MSTKPQNSPASIARASSTIKGRRRSTAHPRYTLLQVEKLARVAFDIGPRRCDEDRVAQAVRYSGAQNGSFIALRATAGQFGLITAKGGELSVSEEWIDIFNSEDTERLRRARQSAMHQPDLYKQIFEDYSGRQISEEKLAQNLHINPKYGILKDAAPVAAKVFIDSATYAGLLDQRGYLQTVGSEDGEISQDVSKQRNRDSATTAQYAVNNPTETVDKLQERTLGPMGDGTEMIVVPRGLDRIVVQLLNGEKAYLFLPVPLPWGEKDRLKRYLDLVLEAPSTDV